MISDTGADPGFSERRGAKDVHAAHIPSAKRVRGPWRALLRALEALGSYMIFHAIWALFGNILIPKGIELNILIKI